jgi:hypothetical protein
MAVFAFVADGVGVAGAGCEAAALLIAVSGLACTSAGFAEMAAFVLASDGVGVGRGIAVCERTAAANATISNSSTSARGWSLRSKPPPLYKERFCWQKATENSSSVFAISSICENQSNQRDLW